MHVHILGICGTFMGGLALLARALGYRVSGSDANVYPPMSTQLAEQGIALYEGYDEAQFDPRPDCVVIGNALSRGNPAVEYVLNNGLRYTSGPQFLSEQLLVNRWVLAVAGTHGKTTTSAMLAHILRYAGMSPGFLIGGIAHDLGVSAALGAEPFFVIEADEYDTAFFDKRSKFVHYRPRTLVLNNLEYDHADIFPDLDAIKRQFQHLLRVVPGQGLVIHNADERHLTEVLAQGCWSGREPFSLTAADMAGWHVGNATEDYSEFDILYRGAQQGHLRWRQSGLHNVGNALAAIAAARHAGVPVRHAIAALAEFAGVRRRLQNIGCINGVTVYDDFAHHPTAIKTTIDGLRRRVASERIIAVFEARSNSMRMGAHSEQLAQAFNDADAVWFYAPAQIPWNIGALAERIGVHCTLADSIENLCQQLVAASKAGDHILIMSNGAFGGLHARLLAELEARAGG